MKIKDLHLTPKVEDLESPEVPKTSIKDITEAVSVAKEDLTRI